MDLEYQPIQCAELKEKILLVKLPDGSFKKFLFNKTSMSFDTVTCSDCHPAQLDSDLTPRHTDWCSHTRTTIVFAYNHVVKQELKYRFDCDSGSFHEIECSECHLNPEKTTDPKQIVLVATSPKSRRAIVLTMNKEGRMQKMQYDEKEKKYVDMESTGIKSLVKRQEEPDISEAMSSLSLKDAPPMESKLIPLYLESYPSLFDGKVFICKNSDTGKLGMYVFEQYHQQFLHVVLPDIKYKQDYKPNFGRLVVLTQSAMDGRPISIVHDETGLKKYHFKLGDTFKLTEEKVVIDEERDVELLIENIKKRMEENAYHPYHLREALVFLRKILPYMVKQNNGTNLADYCEPHLYTSSSSSDEKESEDKDSQNKESEEAEAVQSDTSSTASSTSSDEDEESDTDDDSSSSSSDSSSDSSDDSYDIIFDEEVVAGEKDKTD